VFSLYCEWMDGWMDGWDEKTARYFIPLVLSIFSLVLNGMRKMCYDLREPWNVRL
jgi:hypothetical protein